MNGDSEVILQNLIRIGTVSSVDSAKGMARVKFPGMNDIVSDWLSVVQTSKTEWVPKVNDPVLCLYFPIFNGPGFVLGVLP